MVVIHYDSLLSFCHSGFDRNVGLWFDMLTTNGLKYEPFALSLSKGTLEDRLTLNSKPL